MKDETLHKINISFLKVLNILSDECFLIAMAYLVVPLVGAFFIDLVNMVVIQTYLNFLN